MSNLSIHNNLTLMNDVKINYFEEDFKIDFKLIKSNKIIQKYILIASIWTVETLKINFFLK